MYDDNFRELLNYYNFDRGTDLPDECDYRFPYRAVCANIAWCMVNKDRFWEYYNKSEYWRVKLRTALKHFGSKYYAWGQTQDKSLVKFRETILNNFEHKFIISPHNLDMQLDISTIYNILYQAEKGIY